MMLTFRPGLKSHESLAAMARHRHEDFDDEDEEDDFREGVGPC